MNYFMLIHNNVSWETELLLSMKCFVFDKSFTDFTEMADLCNDINW